MLSLIDILSNWGPFLIVGGGVVLLVYYYRQASSKAGGMEEAFNRAEERFAEQAIAELGEPVAPPATSPVAPSPPPPTAPAESPGEFMAAPKAQTIESVVSKLQSLGVIKENWGEIPLAVPPNGKVYRSSKGGLVGILPHMQGEETLVHLARKHERVLCITASGEVLVIERLDGRLAELIDSRPKGY